MTAGYLRTSAIARPEPGWNYGLWRSAFFESEVARGASFGVYNQRLVPVSYGGDRFAEYRALRERAAMYDVSGERTLEIRGPDAARLMNYLICRDIMRLRPGRAAYGLLCYSDGGLLCDGIVLRLAEDLLWYVHASGEVTPWLRAHAEGLDVEVLDPEVSVIQVQGPRSLDILHDACSASPIQPLSLFDCTEGTIAGQPVVLSRTGWTGELGCEIYVAAAADGAAVWQAVEKAGMAHDMVVAGLDSMDIRRIEAGILNYGSDMDATMTPFAAGLEPFVDLSKPVFVGRDALLSAARRSRICGLTCAAGEPRIGGIVTAESRPVGVVTAGGYSPYLERGVAIVRLDAPRADGAAVDLEVPAHEGESLPAQLNELPLYDRERRLLRGLPFVD